MQGKRSGVAARFLSENPAAIPVHGFAHSLNLCLQGVGKNVVCIRDALDMVKEIGKLIQFSPKRHHLFSLKFQQASDSGVSLRILCPTRWTARTAAIDTILKDYGVLLEVLEEIHEKTIDEYGTKAFGLLQLLEKFNILFGLSPIQCSGTGITCSPEEEHSNTGYFISSRCSKGTLQAYMIRPVVKSVL